MKRQTGGKSHRLKLKEGIKLETLHLHVVQCNFAITNKEY